MSRIRHIPECAVVATTATNATGVRALDLIKNVVLVVSDGIGREKVGKLVATRVLVGPVLHGLEHIPVNLDGVVAGSGMMECTEHIVDNFIHGNTSVFPRIQDTTRFVSSQRST